MATRTQDKIETSADAPEQKGDSQAMLKLHDFVRRYAPPQHEHKRDTLNERYRVELSTPLPEFDSKSATAYAATDLMDPERQMIAQVCRPGTVQRHRAINALKPVSHAYLVSLVASGIVEMSRPEEERYVIFFERPAGKKLSALLSERKTMNPHFLCDRILAPLAAAIHQLSELEISHGLINPDNIYFTDVAMLGPCVSEPCGYSQLFYYEPIERMQAVPAGKGEGTTAHDYYALAVLVLEAMHGPEHFADVTQEELANAILREGVYNALTRQKEIPEMFYDFFRGMLSQTSEERWNYRHMKPWLDGKRYNVLPPPPPTEAIRPFDFAGVQANTRRELAHLFATHWDQIPSALRDGHLTQWVSVSLRNKELADQIARVTRSVGESNPKNEMQFNEQLMRVIMLLDPSGPIRIKNLSFHIDGIDTLFAELFITKANGELQILAKFIELNLASYWLELQRRDPDYVMPTAVNAILTKLDKLRASIRNAGLGFGLERVYYELNPEQPCMSPLLAGSYVTTLLALVKKLDRMAPTMGRNDDPVDKHIAAFIASKLGIQHEIRLHGLSAMPSLASNRAILALYLLSSAQQKAGNITLPGLTHWIGLRIMPALEVIHSKTLKQDVKDRLMEQVQSGYTQVVAEGILNADFAVADQKGFNHAWRLYHSNAAQIESYRKGAFLDQKSARVGFAIAKAVAYVGMMFSIISVIKGM